MARTITIELTVPEALYASAALGKSALTARSSKSGDEWLDATAAALYEDAKAKIERALYPDIAVAAEKAAERSAAWGFDS